jgi:hypothetical protein
VNSCHKTLRPVLAGGLTASAAGILVLAHGPMISGGRGSTFQLIMTNPTGTSPA